MHLEKRCRKVTGKVTRDARGEAAGERVKIEIRILLCEKEYFVFNYMITKNKAIKIEELCINNLSTIRKIDGYTVYIKKYKTSLPPNLKIYRYVRLSYLIDFIINYRLFVPSIKQFADLIEVNGCKKYDDLLSFHPVPSHKDKRINAKRDKDMDQILSLCAKSWTMDVRNDGSVGENMLMWRTYAANEIVCRIGTTVGDVVENITQLNGDVVFADINYGRHDHLNTYEQVLFNKSIYYDQEQEIRMLYLVENINGAYISVNPFAIIKEITISPFVPPQTASFVISQLRNISKDNPSIEMHISPICEYKGEMPKHQQDNKIWR